MPATQFVVPANPNLIDAGGTVLRASSVADLATEMGVDASALQQTVDEHNRFISEGGVIDPPRTTTQHQVSWKNKAWQIVKPPFLAIPICAGISYTTGGIATDGDARVLAEDDSVIPGLFAAGGCTGGLEGWDLGGYVGGLSKASVFGLRAGDRIAQDLVDARQ